MGSMVWMGAACAGVAALAFTSGTDAAEFYGVRFNGQLTRIDTSAQSVTGLGNIRVGPVVPDQFEDLEFDGAGNLYAVRGYNNGNFPPVNFNEVYRVLNPALGNSLLSASLDHSTAKRHANIAFRSSNGQFYSNRNFDGQLGTLNVTTGAFASVAGVPNGGRNFLDALAVNPVTGLAYGIVDLGLSIFGQIDYSLIRMDLDTGLATTIGSLGQGSSQFKALRFDSAGTAYTVNYETGDVLTVNLATGGASFLFAGGPALTQVTGLAHIVPSPASGGLLLLGSLAMTRRRGRAAVR